MTTSIPSGTAAQFPAEVQAVWEQLEQGLTAYLHALHARIPAGAEVENDLRLDLPTRQAEGPAPFARLWFDGHRHYGEIRGMADAWRVTRVPMDADDLAAQLVAALRDTSALPHPGLLTYVVTGPAADLAERLGLVPTEQVAEEGAPLDAEVDRATVLASLAVEPGSPERLHELVGIVLADISGEQATVDDDGDHVIKHAGQAVYLRARRDQPVVEIFARAVHGVRSRRLAASDIAQLNRDGLHVTWVLHGHDIWMRTLVPSDPFAPKHLRGMLRVFLEGLSSTRADLALRTGGMEG